MTGPDTEHAELGPSAAARWMACPGSVAMQRGIPDPSTPYSEEGTAAHSLAEMAFQRNRPAKSWVGDEINGVAVDSDMAEHVQTYVDALRDYAEGAEIVEIESRLDLAPLRPPAPMHGTCDAWFFYPVTKLLRVVDLKFGKGVVVEVEGNAQTRYYALMAWVKLATMNKAKADRVEEIEVVIVQPRAFHPDGPIRVERITLKELKAFGRELLEAAKATMANNPPRIPGSHCHFCRAKLICPEFREQALAVAKVEFADVEAGEVVPPDPMKLTSAQLGAILRSADVLEAWLKVVKQRAFGELEAGRIVEGWALKPKRAYRKWADAAAVPKWARKAGIKKADLMTPPKLRSPAQIETLAKKVGAVLPDELVTRESSGYTLCPSDDPKALIPDAEFQVLEETDDDSVGGEP